MDNKKLEVKSLLKDEVIKHILLRTFDEKNQLKYGYHDYNDLVPEDKKLYKLENDSELNSYIYRYINNKYLDNIPWEKLIERNSSICEKGVLMLISNIKRSRRTKSEFVGEILDLLYEKKHLEFKYKIKDGIVYREGFELKEITSISSMLDSNYIRGIYDDQYYRGHGSLNYTLIPNVMRTSEMVNQEAKMYKKMLQLCPNEFPKNNTTLENMVKMQHYSLPTRLLDITSNPLVALYFACSSEMDSVGELILFKKDKAKRVEDYELKLSVLSNFGIIGRITDDQEDIINTCKILKRNIVRELPEYSNEINQIDLADLLTTSVFYSPPMNNQRIVKQSGSFILCSQAAKDSEIYNYRDFWDDTKRLILYIKPDSKRKILKELEKFNINEASMFPEIEHIAKHIKDTYLAKTIYQYERATSSFVNSITELFSEVKKQEK